MMVGSCVSIVVPAYNDPTGVQATLDSLLTQSINDPYNVHVVDNNSTDQTSDIIRTYEKDHETLSLHHERDIQSSYAARNTGIRNTDSDLLVFVDADVTVPEDWLESALDTFETKDADYIGCNVELIPPESPSLPARYDHHTGFPVAQYLEHQQFAPTCCLLVRRKVFEEVGLFDHRLESSGDKEFGNRVHDAGYDLHFAENVTIYHPTRNSLQAHVSKDHRVGRGLCQLQRFHSERYGTPGIPPRPSGVKRPEPDLSTRERIAFGALSRFLTGVRGLGYYTEYVSGDHHPDSEGVPHLDETE